MPMPLSPVSATWIMEAGASMGFDLSEADAQKLARGVNGEIDGYASLDTLAQPNANESISVNDVEMVDDPHNAYITRFIAGGGRQPPWRCRCCCEGQHRCRRCTDVWVTGLRRCRHLPKRDCRPPTTGGGSPARRKDELDELAYGRTSETSGFGAVTNPADEERVAGGSSSGSAAAVAEGSADLAIGSDTGGSVRIPASLASNPRGVRSLATDS